jgi:hypothetical protein
MAVRPRFRECDVAARGIYAAGSQVQRMQCCIISGGRSTTARAEEESIDGAPGIW